MGDLIPFGMISEKVVLYHQIYHTFSRRNVNVEIVRERNSLVRFLIIAIIKNINK